MVWELVILIDMYHELHEISYREGWSILRGVGMDIQCNFGLDLGMGAHSHGVNLTTAMRE